MNLVKNHFGTVMAPQIEKSLSVQKAVSHHGCDSQQALEKKLYIIYRIWQKGITSHKRKYLKKKVLKSWWDTSLYDPVIIHTLNVTNKHWNKQGCVLESTLSLRTATFFPLLLKCIIVEVCVSVETIFGDTFFEDLMYLALSMRS